MLRLELLFRTGFFHPLTHLSENRSGQFGVWVPVTHLWWEGPQDMHIHFGGDYLDEDNTAHPPHCTPHCGDYVVPDPDHSSGFVRCYSMMVFPITQPREKWLPKADEAYLRRLRQTWQSPNSEYSPKWDAAVRAYDALLSETTKGVH